MDSAGLGELVSAYTILAHTEGHLSIANLPKKILDILYITKLNTVFDIHDSIDDAVASLRG